MGITSPSARSSRAEFFRNSHLKYHSDTPIPIDVPAAARSRKIATGEACPPGKEISRGRERNDQGVPPSKREVQLGRRTGGRRGAPFGNRNRLVHGAYPRARRARRAEAGTLRHATRNLICRLVMFAHAQKALRLKKANIKPNQRDESCLGGLNFHAGEIPRRFTLRRFAGGRWRGVRLSGCPPARRRPEAGRAASC